MSSTAARPDPVGWRPGSHAVVVGAGPAGVAAALALARTTERVTLIDRADVPGRAWEERPRPAEVREVLASPQVVVRAGLEVVGFVVGFAGGGGVRRPAGGRRATMVGGRSSASVAGVVGVLVRSRRQLAGAPTEILADLVVDARGDEAVPARLTDWSGQVTRQGRDLEGSRPVTDEGGWAARGAS